MTQQYDTIIFNHDGTLFEADQVRFPALVSALLDLRKIHNIQIPLPSKEKIKLQIGLNVDDFYKSLIPENHHENLSLIIESTNQHEKQNIKKGFGRFYDGVLETLKQIKEKNIKIGLYSLSHPDYFKALSERFAYNKLFDYTHSSGICPNCDKEKIIKTCIEKLNGKKVLLIGDCESDILAGKKNKCDTAAVLYGYGKEELSDKAAHKIKNIAQTMKLLK